MKWVYHPTGHPEDEKMENTPLVVDGVLYADDLTEVVALDAVTGRAVLEALAPVQSRRFPYATYLPGQQGSGDRREHVVLGDGSRLSSARHRYQDRPGEMGGCGCGLEERLPVQRAAFGGEEHGDPRTCDERYGRKLLGRAFDINTGKEVWKFYTSPMTADDPAAKTWAGDTWKHGGSPIWNGGSYDPETNLSYFGTGNPNPGWNGDERVPGGKFDNLYSDSVVAVRCRHRKAKVVLPIHPGRRVRLGLPHRFLY